MIITVEMLTRNGASVAQVERFSRLFGNSCRVTLARCLRHQSDFDYDWAARNLLSAPAREAYEKATAPAWEAYEKATATAWEAYEKATAPAREAYKKATDPAREAYEKATAPAWEAYEKARATAFFNACKLES